MKDHHDLKRISGTNPLRRSYTNTERIEKLKNICWICDGWHQTKIKWEPGTSGNADSDPIYWHSDYEGYKPLYIRQNNTKFELDRMVPPGEMLYFYTADDV